MWTRRLSRRPGRLASRTDPKGMRLVLGDLASDGEYSFREAKKRSLQSATAVAAGSGSPPEDLDVQKGVVAGTPKVSQDSVHLLRLGSWNLAGVAEGDAVTILAEQVGMDVVAVQEWPKAKPGWKLMSHAGYNAVIFQDIMTYRGVGVVYRDSSLRLLGSECNAEYESHFKSSWRGCPATMFRQSSSVSSMLTSDGQGLVQVIWAFTMPDGR